MSQPKIYDIIIFENYHLATNHSYDRDLIGRLLSEGGMNVAIADIYGTEDGIDSINGIPVIHLNTPRRVKIPDDRFQLHPKNKIHSLLSHLRLRYQMSRYMKSVRDEIKDMAAMFYCGSYHETMSTAFMSLDKPCYYWGLRSSRFTGFLRRCLENPVVGLQSWRLRRHFLKSQSQRLFVSNDLILNEHAALGVPRDRMIIRQERVADQSPDPRFQDVDTGCITFLAIGLLRKEKRIEYTIGEFATYHRLNPQSRLIIAGESIHNYEESIRRAINAAPAGITRINKRLDYQEYHRLMHQAHFIVLADERQSSSVTNGTMAEAIIDCRPVIAPDYEPYTSFTGQGTLGILYNPQLQGALCQAMQQAQERGCRDFYPDILKYLTTVSAPAVAAEFTQSLKSNQHVSI